MAVDNIRFAAAYVRVSTDMQAELSPDSQLEEIRKFAGREGYVLLKDRIYIDAGISGRKADKRPEFQNMIAAAKSGNCPFSVILIWKFSRFARNQEESIFYKNVLRRKCNVDVISVSEPISTDPYGSLIERIIEWMDEFYSIRLSQEVKRSMTVNAERGIMQTKAPFGYIARNRQYEVVEEEAKTVQYIFSSFLSGASFRHIALSLRDMGVHARSGSMFTCKTVRYILRNPVYIGKLRWNPDGKLGYNGKSEFTIIADGKQAPIIDRDVWDAVQARLDAMAHQNEGARRPQNGYKHWLAGGCLKCADYGHTILVKRQGGKLRTRCAGNNVGICQSMQSCNIEVVEGVVLEALEADTTRDDIAVVVRYSNRDKAMEAKRLEALVASIRKKLDRLREAYLNEVIELDVFASSKKELESQLAKANADMEEAKALDNTRDIVAAIHSAMAGTLETLRSEFASIDEKREAFLDVVERCTFSKKDMKLDITYRWDR